MSSPKYTLIPNVGKDIHLVQLTHRLPSGIPPYDNSKEREDQGPEWASFLSLWDQIESYYGYGCPGANWKKQCNMIDNFTRPGGCPTTEIYSGIFLFIRNYQKFAASPDLEKLSDEDIKECIWDCLVSARAHVWTGQWRVWDDWGKYFGLPPQKGSSWEEGCIAYQKEYNSQLKYRENIQKMLAVLLSNQEKAKIRYEEDLIAYGKLGTSSLLVHGRKKKKRAPLGHPLYPRVLEYWTRVLSKDISEYLEKSPKTQERISEYKSLLEKVERWLSKHSPPE